MRRPASPRHLSSGPFFQATGVTLRVALILAALPGLAASLAAQSSVHSSVNSSVQSSVQTSASHAALRPLAQEDYYQVKSVGSVQLSPDGRWVTYTASLPVEESNGDVVES